MHYEHYAFPSLQEYSFIDDESNAHILFVVLGKANSPKTCLFIAQVLQPNMK